jgi:hypothetical protein
MAPLVDSEVMPLKVPSLKSTVESPFKDINGLVEEMVLPKEREFAWTDSR